ncbi:hypothetical protein [Flaviaesturariibacter amylovorans]|uniref:Stress-induced protein n=1 Tax=Flaviaesturariibacter amylovorans TaxID=1084520 RepID=A0ABP8H3Q1_9BACT
MENQRNRDQHPQQQQNQERRSSAPQGFEGMNFEEQRGSYKNSDGAGVRLDRNESMKQRNGKSGQEQ